MRKLYITCVMVMAVLLLPSCMSTRTKGDAFPLMYEENPTVILVMPPINQSTNVEAKDYFYTTMNVPFADAGYYVLPPNLTLAYLQKESAYDSEMFLEADLSLFKELLGADVALFTIIKSWDKMIGPVGSVMVGVEYILRSTQTGEVLYHRDAMLNCSISSKVGNQGSVFGLVLNILATSVKTASTDYIQIAVDCNDMALSDIPAGLYSPYYQQDQNDPALADIVRKGTNK